MNDLQFCINEAYNLSDSHPDRDFYLGKYTGLNLAKSILQPLLDTANNQQTLVDEINRLNALIQHYEQKIRKQA